ncbi:type I-E CRISPR-associated protein Cas6/Cse3/CasE [Thiolapillus brandeum]|uniref:CRISPR-associated CSE3 family protein n=1 Tax=Thiolapillus brandeum TaxID=1076588 RepID=A0A7U6JHK5_9GAMM|nr:type I-E CRISPR-associated protein Cas6/Cse3/CasE [Thiolapillus brandeum]BAO44421.1 CRISPR-associated CSE3 family protein [Thiolapillus brandeum]
MMYLSRIRFTPEGIRAQCRKGVVANPFREHQMIWDLFDNPPDQTRDFLYRREDRPGKPPFYYLLSARQPKAGNSYLTVETKSFEPHLQAGDQLRFELRANAVITRKAGDNSKRRLRRDIIEAKVDEYKARCPDPADRPPPSVIHQEAAEEWMQRQGEQHGFEVSELLVANHSHHKVRKPGDDNLRQFTSIDVFGTLTVTDTDRFMEQMMKGMGRAKAFGCGLMLVRRA